MCRGLSINDLRSLTLLDIPAGVYTKLFLNRFKTCFSSFLVVVATFHLLCENPECSRNKPIFGTSMHNYSVLTSTVLHYTICFSIMSTLTNCICWICVPVRYTMYNKFFLHVHLIAFLYSFQIVGPLL